MDTSRPTWTNQTKVIVILVLLASLVFLLYKFSAVITPLILACILAYVLSPLVNGMSRRLSIPRGLAILLTYLLMFVAIGAILRLVIPPLLVQARGIGVDLQILIAQTKTFLNRQFILADTFIINGNDLLDRVAVSLQGLLQPVFDGTLNVIIDVVSSLAWAVFIVVISIYLIKDTKALLNWLDRLPPLAYREDFTRLRGDISVIWASFFRGQIILSLIVTMIITTEALIIGLPFPLLMGVLAGLLEFLPSIGHGIWLVTSLLVALFGGSTWLPLPNWAFALLIVALHAVFTQFDLNYLIPKVIGSSVHLHPLVIILGILGGAALAGVLGVVLAAPTIASLRVLGRYIYARLVDEEPFRSTSEPAVSSPNLFWWRHRTKDISRSIDQVDKGI